MMRETHDIPLGTDGLSILIADIGLGTPRQEFRVQLDLGTAHFYVPSSHCQGCYFQKRYDGNASLTHVKNGTLFTIAGASGVVSQDILYLDDLKVKDQQFGEALSLNGWGAYGRDGILGLAYDPLEPNGSATGPESFLIKLRRHGAVEEPLLGLYIGDKFKSPYGGGVTGQFTIGGVDDYRYKGRLQWVDAFRPGQWSVDLKELVIDWDRKASGDGDQITLMQAGEGDSFRDKKEGTRRIRDSNSDTIWPTSASVPAHLRPGWLYISIPSAMARDLNEALGLTESSTYNDLYYYLECSKLNFEDMPNVGVRIGRAVYWLTPQEYLVRYQAEDKDECLSQFTGLASRGIETETDKGAVLGTLFMRKFFTALDFEAHRVGFAMAK